jgi:hypothetical protein
VAVSTWCYPCLDVDGGDDRWLPVVAEFSGHRWNGHVLHDVEAAGEWIVTWTDGINEWLERYDYPWHALARFAALVAAAEQDVFLVHDSSDPHGPLNFVAEAERFVSRTIHASSCEPGCDGTDPVNHQV